MKAPTTISISMPPATEPAPMSEIFLKKTFVT